MWTSSSKSQMWFLQRWTVFSCPLSWIFISLFFGFYFLNARECSCGLSLDSMSKIAEWLNKRLLTVLICLDSASYTCCQLCLALFSYKFLLFSGTVPRKLFCLASQVKLVCFFQNQINVWQVWNLRGRKKLILYKDSTVCIYYIV